MLTRRCSVFQIISWNWKHLINRRVQAKKVFWQMILHSYLCNVLRKFLIKMEARGSVKSKKTHPSWLLLYCVRTIKSNNRTCFTKKGCSCKFRNIHSKNLCWGLFLKKLRAFRTAAFFKKRPQHRFFLVKLGYFQDAYFEKYLWTAASWLFQCFTIT